MSDQASDSVHTASTLPADRYTSELVFEGEVERLFRREWFPVARTDQLKPLAPSLAELDEKLSAYGFADLRYVKTLSFSSPLNWKIMVENFLESYHHMGTHSETLSHAFPAQGTYGEKVQGNYLLLENPSIDLDVIPRFWAGCILPATLFALIRSNDTPYGIWYQLDIKGRDFFELKVHLLVHESIAEDADAIEGIAASTTAIHLEDIPMCEGVWKGVNSRFYKPGRLSHLEECLWQFYRYLIIPVRQDNVDQGHADHDHTGAKL